MCWNQYRICEDFFLSDRPRNQGLYTEFVYSILYPGVSKLSFWQFWLFSRYMSSNVWMSSKMKFERRTKRENSGHTDESLFVGWPVPSIWRVSTRNVLPLIFSVGFTWDVYSTGYIFQGCRDSRRPSILVSLTWPGETPGQLYLGEIANSWFPVQSGPNPSIWRVSTWGHFAPEFSLWIDSSSGYSRPKVAFPDFWSD